VRPLSILWRSERQMQVESGSASRDEAGSAFARQLAVARALLERADIDEVSTRYKVGIIVAALRDDKRTYGSRAVERLARGLGRDASTLYRYALVSDLCGEREIVSRRNCRGAPLSWSHWEELTRVPTEWKVWLQRTEAEAWSVRQLARQLDARASAAASGDDEASPDTTHSALLVTVRDVRHFGTEVMSSLDALLERIARAPQRERSAEVRDLLATARDALTAAHEKTGTALLHVRALVPEEKARRLK
jgi:hypothetical protein